MTCSLRRFSQGMSAVPKTAPQPPAPYINKKNQCDLDRCRKNLKPEDFIIAADNRKDNIGYMAYCKHQKYRYVVHKAQFPEHTAPPEYCKQRGGENQIEYT